MSTKSEVIHRGGYIELSGEKWWSEEVVKAAERRCKDLEAECSSLAAHQCPHAVAGDTGDMVCTRIAELEGENQRLALGQPAVEANLKLLGRVDELEAKLQRLRAKIAALGRELRGKYVGEYRAKDKREAFYNAHIRAAWRQATHKYDALLAEEPSDAE